MFLIRCVKFCCRCPCNSDYGVVTRRSVGMEPLHAYHYAVPTVVCTKCQRSTMVVYATGY